MTLADTVARITAREERINEAKDNVNCSSADMLTATEKKHSLLDKIDDLENHHRRSNLKSSWYIYNWKSADALEFLGRTLLCNLIIHPVPKTSMEKARLRKSSCFPTLFP